MPDQDKNFYRLLAVLEEQEENLWYAIEKNHEAQRAPCCTAFNSQKMPSAENCCRRHFYSC